MKWGETLEKMDAQTKDRLTQLDNLLASGNQSWLFGAGISIEANIPLMNALTERTFELASSDSDPQTKVILDLIRGKLPPTCHIEHILSHLGDFTAIAERSYEKCFTLDSITIKIDELHRLHDKVLLWIAQTIRWGYSSPSRVGTRDLPIVTVDQHLSFVSSLFFRSQAGVSDRRRAIRLFTTNYDTLLEDALALECVSYWDGFSGGAVAYRTHRYGQNEPESGYRAHVVKLHGSIDWHLGKDDRVWRIRDTDCYPPKTSRVLIYPQSTKYVATQRDPFSAQFDLLRRTLDEKTENVFSICGYSFGDDHINQEIEYCLQRSDNKTTIIAFARELPAALDKWRNSRWGKRLYIVTSKGLFVGMEGPFAVPKTGDWDWWTFGGATKLLKNGAESCIL